MEQAWIKAKARLDVLLGQQRPARRYPADYRETGRIGNSDSPGSAGQ